MLENLRVVIGITLFITAILIGKADKNKGEIVAPPARVANDVLIAIVGLVVIFGGIGLVLWLASDQAR